MTENIIHLTELRKVSENPGICKLSCSLQIRQSTPFELWYELPENQSDYFQADLFDTFLAAALLPAMRLGCDIEVAGPCSPALVKQATGPIADLFLSWFPGIFQRIRVSAAPGGDLPAREAKNSETACFFSCGVDSFYTALKSWEDPASSVTHLVTMHGFDIRLSDSPELFNQIKQQAKSFAERHGVHSLFVRTNIRQWSDKFLDWEIYHGAAMASAGLALSGRLSKFFIASSTGTQTPWGSHPDLDPLWGNGRVQFIHDVIGISRIDKIRHILKESAVLDHLRVCWENRHGAYNCSRCEKCLRTMMCLWILGADKRANTFEWRGLSGNVLRLRLKKRCRHHWWTIFRSLPWTPGALLFKISVLFMLIRSGLFDAARSVRRRLTGQAK